MSVAQRWAFLGLLLVHFGCHAPVSTARSVHVRVIDPASGQPVAGHEIGGFYAFGHEAGDPPFPKAMTDVRGEARLPVNLARTPVLGVNGSKVSLDAPKLRAGETQVIEGGGSGCACCGGQKHPHPLRVEVTYD